MDQTNTNNQPVALFSHTLTFPGVALESLLSSIAMLLSAYGVKHTIGVSPNFSPDSLTSGDANTDSRFTAEYMQFKSMLADLTRQYVTVQASVQSNGSMVYMKFSCY